MRGLLSAMLVPNLIVNWLVWLFIDEGIDGNSVVLEKKFLTNFSVAYPLLSLILNLSNKLY